VILLRMPGNQKQMPSRMVCKEVEEARRQRGKS
jgi:hypothetical protein